MANTQAGFGFRPFGHRDGSAPTMGMERMFIASSDVNSYFTGDAVYLSSAATYGTNPNTISLSSQGSVYIPCGIFVGCEYYSATVGRTVWNNYFPGSVGSSSPCNAYVITDPEMTFIAQCSTTSGVCGSSLIGWGIGIASSLQGSGNINSGQSDEFLASSAVSVVSASLPFRVVDVYSNFAPPGVNGTSTTAEGGAILIVAPNNWLRRGLTMAST